MFRIHADQVQAFAALRRRTFEREAMGAIAGWLGRAPDAALVSSSVDRALSRGIVTEPDVLQHLAIEARLGGDLLLAWPWAAEVLGDERLVPAGKLRVLLREARARGVDIDLLDHCDAVGRSS